MRRIFLFSVSFIFMLFACTKQDISQDPLPTTDNEIDGKIVLTDTLCENSTFRKDGYVYDKNNKTYLWAGIDTSTHFDITDWELNECNLRYGLGRETFPALLDPQYTPLKDYNIDFQPLDQCVVLFSSDHVKVYPYEIMTDYEVINERHNGHPIMIAYCVLADLAAVYDRDYCGVELTFAVSGYTYFDRDIWEGIDAFILWDRDTESLWFPLIDRAISGPLKGHQLEKFNNGLWEIMSWEDIKTAYPDALVINSGQSQETPPKYPGPDPALYTCQ